MRPTGRAVAVFVTGVPLSLLAVLVDGRLWALGCVYLAGAAIALGWDAARALPRRRLAVSLRIPDLLYIGEAEDLVVALDTAGWPASVDVEVLCDIGGTLAPADSVFARVGSSDGQGAAVVRLRARRRGIAKVDRIWLRWRGPIGLAVFWRSDAVAASIPVIPNIRAVRFAAVHFAARDAWFGVKVDTRPGDGSEFNALRDYVPGLDTRSIDWKHSARHRSLVCKEFQTERNHPVILAFDTGHLMSEALDGVPRLDHAINAGLLLGYVALRGGDRVGIFGFDAAVRGYAEPVSGVAHFGRLQTAAAALDYQPAETNFTLGLAELGARLRRRSLIVLFTEFVDTVTAELMIEHMQPVARRHLVVFLALADPSLSAPIDAPPAEMADVARAVVADDILRDRRVVFERLRRLGVLCVESPVARIGPEVVNEYLRIKRREML